MAMTTEFRPSTLGNSVPPHTSHAISVSLPTWRDNVGYEEGEKRVVDAMVTGYPRFFIHTSIQKLAAICERKFGANNERCMLFPTMRVAVECRSFLINHSPDHSSAVPVRVIQYLLCSEHSDTSKPTSIQTNETLPATGTGLHIVLFPENLFPLAKQFWQHTGMGISSRKAERCLGMLPDSSSPTLPSSPSASNIHFKAGNRHYSTKMLSTPDRSSPAKSTTAVAPPYTVEDTFDTEHDVYLEERYGRNMPLSYASMAKRALRRRIAGVLVHEDQACAGANDAKLGPSSRGVEDVTEDEVFLFPTGMSAIWKAHQVALATLPPVKSVCFGFPYTDTLKILQKWGPGCHFFGHGLDAEIDELERLIVDLTSSTQCQNSFSKSPSGPPILALFCEFPSNPLLRTPNLPRLRVLADKYGFPIIVDETVGNFVNVALLPFADIVVSSLTKVFSGDSNVMGGSLVLNPQSRYYTQFKAALSASYEDIYFAEDAIFMERNSRDFKKRVHTINDNADAVCSLLHAHSRVGGDVSAVVKEVFYPKWTTRANFDRCRHPALAADAPRFGGLFSVTFVSKAASEAFFDALPCHKGPSLGTNFTLACPYTVLAHYGEMKWAQSYGVEEGLVRVSVGLEPREELLEKIGIALKAAEHTS